MDGKGRGRATEALLRLLSSVKAGNPGNLSPSLARSVVEEAIAHGVAPFLHGRLSEMNGITLPEGPARDLHDVYLHSKLRASVLPRQLEELAASARASGIRLLALKGAHLSQTVYSDPAYRPMLDIDLLLPVDGQDEFRRHLLLRGYEEVRNDLDYGSMHHARPLRRPGGFTVELHRRLSREEEALRVDLGGIWHRAVPWKGFEGALFRMSTEDLLLHLCTHMAYDNHFRVGLLSLLDIDAVLRQAGSELDWSRCAETANADGRAPFVYVALRITQEALGSPLAGDVRDLNHGEEEESLVDVGLTHILSIVQEAPVGVQRLEGASGAGEKGRILAGAVFPPPERMRAIHSLPSNSPWLPVLYLLRPMDLSMRWGRKVMGMVLRRGEGDRIRQREERRRRLTRWTRRPPAQG